MTGLLPFSNDKCDNLKGAAMKYKHFREIEPSNKTDFIMLYFAACRSLRELESNIRYRQNGNLTCKQAWLLRRLYHKLFQMVALWKKHVIKA